MRRARVGSTGKRQPHLGFRPCTAVLISVCEAELYVYFLLTNGAHKFTALLGPGHGKGWLLSHGEITHKMS